MPTESTKNKTKNLTRSLKAYLSTHREPPPPPRPQKNNNLITQPKTYLNSCLKVLGHKRAQHMTAGLFCLPSWMQFMQMHRIQNNGKRKRNLNILISFDHSLFYKFLSLNTLTGFTEDCSNCGGNFHEDLRKNLQILLR